MSQIDRERKEDYDSDLVQARNLPWAVDWGTKGSMIIILIVTLLYTLSPLDFVPDIIPVAGQADDLAALLAGGGSLTFLAVLRFFWRSRIGRWSCLILFALCSIGALTIFYLLARLFSSIF